MGCDIHAYIETYNYGRWVFNDISAYPSEPNPYYTCNRFPHNRNYSFFSFLAGVRSYGDGAPYREERGIPDDCSDEVKKQWDNAKEWNHTPSWYDIDDLIYGIENYGGLFQTSITVTKETKEKYDGMWDKLAPEMLLVLEAKIDDEVYNPNILCIQVDLPFKHVIEKPTLEQIVAIRNEDAPNKSRVVFWFDN